jgi:STE24 endopeptidase
VIGSFLYPVLIEPLFNRFTSLPPGPLRTAVLELADEEGIALDDVLVADASRRTTTLNAYVSGIGSTRRVVLYDTLLESAPREEIEVIVAHELAHTANQDVLRGTVLGALGGVAGVALLALVLDNRGVRRASRTKGAADPAVVPLALALVAVGGFVSSPVINSMSRAVEIRADRDSLTATGMEEEFVLMQRRLALRSVADPTPPALSQFWFGSHPTVLQRVGLPESLAKAAE